MKNILATITLLLILALPQPVIAADLLESYTAYLSDRDHRNSYGERLRSAAAIIRQDRANYHRFGIRDRVDQGDSFFRYKRNRDLLERWLRNGSISRRAINRIVYGTPIIHVRIYGYGRVAEYITVSVE